MAIRYLVPEGQHLPVSGEDGKLDPRLLGAAHAALFKNSRGNPYGGPDKEGAKARLRKLYEEAGIEWPKDTASETPRLVFTLSDFALGIDGSQPRLPIAITGHWVKQTAEGKQEITVTLADMCSMIKNFAKKANGEINVDYDHKSETGAEIADPIPSAGRVTALMEPEKFTDSQGVERWIMWGAYEPTDRARQFIAAKEYRYTSPAFGPGIDPQTGKPQGVTLSTVALTNRPVILQMPEVQLSEPGFELMEAQMVHVDRNISGHAGEKGEGNMNTLKIAKQADGENAGKHLVFDGDSVVGHIPEEQLKAHAKEHLGMDMAPEEACHAAEAKGRTTLLAEIGAAGKAPAEIKTLIERGTVTESALLAETVNDKGKIDTVKLDELVDSGKVKPSATRRALAAEGRVAEAFKAGKIHPVALQQAAKLCLSDETAFKAFIEDGKPVVDLTSQGVVRPAEEGDKPATKALSETIAKRMKDMNETRDVAELNVVRTDEGLKLWNAAMAEGWEKVETHR
jgi:phage I-like protein